MPVSGEFHRVRVDAVRVEDRQRRGERDVAALADSISRSGLFHPIVITRDNRLVAGERRLLAHRELRRVEIPCQYLDELDEHELRAIELEENIKRVDLTWKDRARAFRIYHDSRCESEPEWTVEQTADAIGCSVRSVQQHLQVADEIKKGNEKVLACTGLGSAVNVIQRSRDRAIDAEIDIFTGVGNDSSEIDLSDTLLVGEKAEPSGVRPASADIAVADFIEKANSWDGPRFTTVHCDFPFGISHHRSEQGGAAKFGAYNDTEDIYFNLLKTLIYADNLLATSVHIMFWFPMKHYIRTVQLFEENNFRVDPYPLVWFKSDKIGIVPDAARGPRRTYETALLVSRGDPRVVYPVANCIELPSGKRQAQHLSEKPQIVVQYFLRMLVDSSTRFLDPTCGAGSALCAAEHLDAASVTGWELRSEHVETAQRNLNNTRLAMQGRQSEADYAG
jgi:ParB family chromosome partitioning protein